MKKGFTLIELLAVILILGIIALIAIPVVNDIIVEARQGAWVSSASQIASQYDLYVQRKEIKGETAITEFVTGGTVPSELDAKFKKGSNLDTVAVQKELDIKGKMPSTFTDLYVEDGNAYVSFTVDGITCTNFETTNSTKTIINDGPRCTKSSN